MRGLGGSLLLGLAAATYFLTPVVEQFVRLTPARSYFLQRVPDRLDYLVLIGLIIGIGLITGMADWFGQRFTCSARRLFEAPLWLLFALGVEHVIHQHLGRYPPVWNTVGAAWNRAGVSAANGWFVTGLLCAIPLLAGFYFWPQAWSSAKPILCGGAAVVWLACGLKLIEPAAQLTDNRSVVASRSSGAGRIQPVGSSRPGGPVVWLILDEWDYDLTFKRPDQKVFPAFERLRSQSMFLENVRAAGTGTIVAIPSLLMGRRVTEYRPASAAGAKFVASAPALESFPGPPTIFDSAGQFGYRTHIVGWYHPYCRIFAGRLDTCWWDDLRMQALRPGGSVGARAAAFLRESIELETVRGLGPTNLLLRQVGRVDPMIEQASVAASHSGKSFTFLHLPIPHGPFFKRESDGRITAQPSDVNGYQYGLDEADRALGMVREAMVRANVWDDALVIVTTDHPFRYQFEGGYGNGHIPMMIKFPHQTAPLVYSHPFQAVETKGLIEDFMRGGLPTPERAVAWLERSGSNGPSSGAKGRPRTVRVTLTSRK